MRVLFVGNSHTYFNDMPETFARMCRSLSGTRPEVTMLAYSGRSLAWHREEYFSLRFALLYGGYDYCVLQQQAHPFPPEEETEKAARRILELCRRVGTKGVLFMTWAERAKPENGPRMSRFYRRLAAETGALLAPVGEVFAALGRARPDIDLYWRDGEHASPYGDYLAAALFAALLCRSSPLPLSAEAVDFALDFAGEEGKPLALEEAEAARTVLEEEKTQAILRAVAEALAGE